MSLSNLTSVQLARLIKLIKQKEFLQKQVSAIESEINSLESGAPNGKRGRKPGRPLGTKNLVTQSDGKRRVNKRLKDRVLNALKDAGASGITVKDLAAGLKVRPGNVFSWFYTTGKKISGIKKIGEAKYAYKA